LAGWGTKTTASRIDTNLALAAQCGAAVGLIVNDAIAIIIDAVTLLLIACASAYTGKGAVSTGPFPLRTLSARFATIVTNMCSRRADWICRTVDSVWRFS
jgi:hypothetical protein